jgi:hypothetical protein
LDLFKAFPELTQHRNPALHARTLRLINITGLVYDDESFYFELSDARFWGRTPKGQTSIGIGTPKVRPQDMVPPYETVVRHLQKQWRCHIHLFAPGHSYILDEADHIHILQDVGIYLPYIFIMTPPRLGGADTPDALVQGAYLLPLAQDQTINARVTTLKIARERLTDFLTPESWELENLRKQPWATLQQKTQPLPESAQLRPVLMVRGLRTLQQEHGSLFLD